MHVAIHYTHKMFAALRIDSLCANFLTFLFSYTFTQLGGIPRDGCERQLLLARVGPHALAQFVTTLTTLAFRVCEFLSVRETLYPCLIEVDGVRLLDAHAMVTFPVQTGVVMNLVLLFSNGYLLALAASSSRQRKWPWIKYYYNMRKKAAAPVLRYPLAFQDEAEPSGTKQSRVEIGCHHHGCRDEPPGERSRRRRHRRQPLLPQSASALRACRCWCAAVSRSHLCQTEFVSEATDAKRTRRSTSRHALRLARLSTTLRCNTFVHCVQRGRFAAA